MINWKLAYLTDVMFGQPIESVADDAHGERDWVVVVGNVGY